MAENPWERHVQSWHLREAQLTAVRAHGRSDTQYNLSLNVEEGRYHSLNSKDDGTPEPSTLTYQCFVRPTGSEEPQTWTGEDAAIVITGLHENDRKVTVSGPGLIGYDERGILEICFDQMPTISVDDIDETSVPSPA